MALGSQAHAFKHCDTTPASSRTWHRRGLQQADEEPSAVLAWLSPAAASSPVINWILPPSRRSVSSWYTARSVDLSECHGWIFVMWPADPVAEAPISGKPKSHGA